MNVSGFTRILLGVVLSAASASSSRADQRDDTIALQVHLARVNASPGPIDGKTGKNLDLAKAAFRRMQGMTESGHADASVEDQLRKDQAPVLVDYTITKKDADGPFVDSIPEKMEGKARLKHLGYTDLVEALAEKFHMSQELLKSLNPHAKFAEGETIRVANVGTSPLPRVKHIEVDKSGEVVWVYGKGDKPIAAYPATIGSEDTPSPEGHHKVVSVTKHPTYAYDPAKLDFKGVKTDHKITIAPGPNNPVGLVWIALDGPSYGIHGSPEPERIRRQESHGCVRLTNWDALQLAGSVKKGVPVDFIGSATQADVRENSSRHHHRRGKR